MGVASLFWERLADLSIKLLGCISDRKIYDRGSACSQNPDRMGGFGFANPQSKESSLSHCFWFLIDQAVLVFDGYHKGVSCSVFLFIALAMMLYLDDYCL